MPYDFNNPVSRRKMMRDLVRSTVTNIRMYRRVGMPEQVIEISLNCLKGLRRQHSSHFARRMA